MSTSTEITEAILRRIWSAAASTFFLNGAPGAGKSFYLQMLGDRLRQQLGPRLCIVGPITLAVGTPSELATHIARELEAAGYVDNPIPSSVMTDVSALWHWIATQSHLPKEQVFVVLIDFAQSWQTDLPTLSALFSSARSFEGLWEHRPRVHHVFSTCWNHLELCRYYESIGTSFPYTRGNNYMRRDGLDQAEIQQMLLTQRTIDVWPVHGRLLYELCDGHPAATLEIIRATSGQPLRSANLIAATRRVAMQGSSAQHLVECWKTLSADLMAVVQALTHTRLVQARLSSEQIEVLQTFGLVRLNRLGKQNYLSFRSWYVELVVRLHAEELGIADAALQRASLDDLMPDVSAINAEAYHLVNHIETTARNFVSLYLHAHQTDGSPILAGRAKKYNRAKERLEDAQERAEDWQRQSSEKGLSTSSNPLLAFLGMRDLAQLIAEIGTESKVRTWGRVSQALLDLANVRDAVMHNQLIDDDTLQKLYDSQYALYQALNDSGDGSAL